MSDQTPIHIQVQRYLSGVDYPAQKQDLVEHAESQGAGDDVLSTLRDIDDREYDSPADVSKAIGKTG